MCIEKTLSKIVPHPTDQTVTDQGNPKSGADHGDFGDYDDIVLNIHTETMTKVLRILGSADNIKRMSSEFFLTVHKKIPILS